MYLLILCTTPNKEEAERISRILLEKKIVACTNIISEVNSFFLWKRNLDNSKESLILIKTLDKLYNEVERVIKENHQYEIPEIISFRIERGSKDYLNWMDEELKPLP